MKSGELANLLGVDKGTIRNWVKQFGRFFTPSAKGQGVSQAVFTEADVLVLNTIRGAGGGRTNPKEIETLLDSGFRNPEFPQNAISKDTRVIPMPQAQQAAETMVAKRELDLVVQDRDRAYERIGELEAQIQSLNDRWREDNEEKSLLIGELRAEVKALKKRLGEGD